MAEWTTEERAVLGRQLRALLASGEAGVTAAFRYRHGWIPVGGDRKAAEKAGADAEAASQRATGELTHNRAAVAHHAASRAYAKAGNEERAAHHEQMALHHSKEAAKSFHYAEDEPDLTQPKYDAAFGRPLRSTMHDDDMSGSVAGLPGGEEHFGPEDVLPGQRRKRS